MNKIIKNYIGEIKSVDKENYRAKVLVSTNSVDRDGEVIDVKAFEKRMAHFIDHPVLLSSHNYYDLRKQIGEALDIKQTEGGLEATFEWYVGKGNEEADWAWFLATKGIAGFSIGFIAHEIKTEIPPGMKASRIFMDVELLEISQVLVPSNRDAVMTQFRSEDQFQSKIAELAMKSFEGKDWKHEENNLEKELKALRLELDSLKAQVAEIKQGKSLFESILDTQDDLVTNTIEALKELKGE